MWGVPATTITVEAAPKRVLNSLAQICRDNRKHPRASSNLTLRDSSPSPLSLPTHYFARALNCPPKAAPTRETSSKPWFPPFPVCFPNSLLHAKEFLYRLAVMVCTVGSLTFLRGMVTVYSELLSCGSDRGTGNHNANQ